MKLQPILCSFLLAAACSCSCSDEPVFRSSEQPELPTLPTVPEGSYFADSLEYTPEKQRQTLTDIQQGYFRFFYENYQKDSKMALIGTERPAINVALAGSAYAATAIPVAVERGWISRKEGAQRFLDMCTFLNRAERYHGAWSHWMNGKTGAGSPFNPKQQSAGDLVETAFMMMGLFICSEYFNSEDATETNARELVAKFHNEIDWRFYTNGEQTLYWAWDKNLGFAPLKITGPCETLPAYLLALSAPEEFAITEDVYTHGWRGKNFFNQGRTTYGYTFELGGEEKGGPLFTTQHPFLWINPFIYQDNYADYWEFCTNHALINRQYCLNDAPKEYLYDERNWGLSACYGPEPLGYKGRSPAQGRDDGTICATGAMGAVTVTPFYALQAINSLYETPRLKGTYGITDAYNTSMAWADSRYLSISVMPIVSIIENYRTGLIWKLARQSEPIRKGLELAGFRESAYTEGFCQNPVNLQTGAADLTVHPDTENYMIRYWSDTASANIHFTLSCGDTVRKVIPDAVNKGINTLLLPYNQWSKRAYCLNMYKDNKLTDTLNINLR